MIKMMDQNQIVKQMTDFQQTAMNTSFNAMEVFQSRTEKMMQMFWDQAAWASDKSGNMLLDWTKAWEAGCETLQKTMESNCARFEKFDLMPK